MNKTEDLVRFKKSFDSLIIKHKNRIVITAHINPDDDAIASVLGVHYYLKNIKKVKNEVKIFYSNNKVARWEKIKYSKNIEFVGEISDQLNKNDLLIMLDCQGFFRVSSKEDEMLRIGLKTVVIDHHKTAPDKTYNLTLAYPTIFKSSNAEVIYSLFFSNLKILKKEIAEILLMGIYSDTGGFRFGTKEQSSSFLVAKQIIDKSNVNVDMFLSTLENYKLEHLRVLALLINNIKTYNIKNWGRFSISYLSKQNIKSYTKEDVSGGKSLYGMYQKSINNCNWGILIYPDANNTKEWSLSFRSSPGHPNVRLIAQALDLNGGGHDAAAGAKLTEQNQKNKLNEKIIIKIILNYLKNNLPSIIPAK